MNNQNNNNLPKGWRKVKLGEIVEKVIDNRGKNPPLSNIKTAYKLIDTLQLTDNTRYPNFDDETKQRYVSEDVYNTWFRSGHPLAGDILMSTVGSGIPKWNLFPSEGNFCIAQNLIGLRVNKNKANFEFIFYYFRQETFLKMVKGIIIGGAQPSIKVPHFLDLEIEIPEDPNEQKRIADILSAFDDKIELNNKIIKTLEEMAQEIFKEWFNKNSKLKNQKSKLEGWEIKDAEEVFVFEKGIEPGSKYYSETKKEGYIPFYRVRDLDKQSGVDVYIPEKIANGKICKENDVLLSLDATVGRVKIGCNGAFSSGIRKVYSRDGFIKNSFIYFCLKTPYVQNTILEHASGTTILHAGQSIKYLKLLFNKEVIEKIQSKVDPMFEKILQILKENQTLAALRDLLLPKLMSGEIRV
jgi:type I restriction enzyme S subunit